MNSNFLQMVKAGKTASNIAAFAPQSVSGSAAIKGSIIDRLGARSAFLSNLRAAVTGSPTAAKIKLEIQHGDESDLSDVSTGFTFATTVAGVDAVADVATVLAVADDTGSLNDKYFLMSSPYTDYYVWMNVNSLGTDPAVAGKTGVEVAVATGALAAVVAAAIKAAIDALGGFSATLDTATVTITNAAVGAVTAIADSSAAATGFTFATTTPGVDAVSEVSTVLPVADDTGSLNNLYFLLSSPYIDYYVWFNVNSEGTDPLISGKTGVEVAIDTDATAAEIGSAIQVAIDALSTFGASLDTATVTITAVDAGAADNISDTDSGIFLTLETGLDVNTAAGAEDYFLKLGSAKRYIRIINTPTFTGGSTPAYIGAASMVLGDLKELPIYDDDDAAPEVYGD